MSQKVTSACTSINKNKLPAIYGKLPETVRDCYLLDYGCGKYTEHIEKWAAARGIIYLPFDPYNQPENVNELSMDVVRAAIDAHSRVVSVCSNVLNVIDSNYEVARIAGELFTNSDEVYVTVYEGDRSGVGRYTGPDSYQRNEKLADYVGFFPCCKVKKGLLFCAGMPRVDSVW